MIEGLVPWGGNRAFKSQVINIVDEGNSGAVIEYKTNWDALSGDKLPTTEDETLYKNNALHRIGIDYCGQC